MTVAFPRHAETYACTLPTLVLAAPLAEVGRGWGCLVQILSMPCLQVSVQCRRCRH